jgi:UDP-galactose transporter B1
MTLEFFLCVLGVYACFLTWGITQERVTSTRYPPDSAKFTYFILLNTCQASIASLVSMAYHYLSHSVKQTKTSQSFNLLRIPRALRFKYIQLSILNTLASPFGYAALKHIDYPTLILGKSCKLIPVMLMNFVLYRKTFPPYKYFVVALITAGVSSFMLLHPQETGHKGSASSSLFGLGLLFINLLLDGATNSTQDSLFSRHKVSGVAMMFHMNLYSSALMLGHLLLNPLSGNEWSKGTAFVLAHPQVLRDILIFCLAGAFGQLFIFYTLQRFGSLSLVTVTVTRKMFSILISVFWFGHSLNLSQW